MCVSFFRKNERIEVSPMGEHARFFFALCRTDDGDE